MMVERRDQVLRTFFDFWRCMSTTFFIKLASMKGPFFIERAMASSIRIAPLGFFAAVFDDHRVGALVLTGLETLRELTPGRAGVPAARRSALATAHRVIDRVHGDAAVVRAASLPARAPRLADVDAAVLDVADLPDGGAALEVDAPGLARRQPQLAPVAFLGHLQGAGARRAADLRAARDLELDVVDRGAERHEPQRQVVPRLDIGVARGEDHVADLEAVGAEDVTLLAVGVVQQGDARRAVGIVLDGGHRGGDAQLVATEIDEPEAPLVTAAAETRGDAAVVIAAAGPGDRGGERLFRMVPLRQLGEVGRHAAAASGGGGVMWTKTHGSRLLLDAFEEFDVLAG